MGAAGLSFHRGLLPTSPAVAAVLVLGLILCMSTPSAEARVRHHRWEITYQFKSPDFLRKLAVTINGETPGPTIYAQQGDTVVVEVKNGLLTENASIHWHGIRQIGSPWSDGTEGVTRCPMLPGETFIYKFVVDRLGTYIYHAHYGMQRSIGLYGYIIITLPNNIKEEPIHGDDDQSSHKHTTEAPQPIIIVVFLLFIVFEALMVYISFVIRYI